MSYEELKKEEGRTVIELTIINKIQTYLVDKTVDVL